LLISAKIYRQYSLVDQIRILFHDSLSHFSIFLVYLLLLPESFFLHVDFVDGLTLRKLSSLLFLNPWKKIFVLQLYDKLFIERLLLVGLLPGLVQESHVEIGWAINLTFAIDYAFDSFEKLLILIGLSKLVMKTVVCWFVGIKSTFRHWKKLIFYFIKGKSSDFFLTLSYIHSSFYRKLQWPCRSITIKFSVDSEKYSSIKNINSQEFLSSPSGWILMFYGGT